MCHNQGAKLGTPLLTKSCATGISLVFPNALFLFRGPIRKTTLGCPVSFFLLWAMTVFQTFLVSDDLDSFEES